MVICYSREAVESSFPRSGLCLVKTKRGIKLNKQYTRLPLANPAAGYSIELFNFNNILRRNQIAAAFTRKLTIYSYRIYRCRYSERL